MSNPAFIVDGFTEQLVLQRICPGSPIRRTDLNGKSVKISAIANKVYSLIKLLNNRYYPIFILIDRECRVESCEVIAAELRQELSNKGLENEDIRIGVADRMFENWIIADWASLGYKPLNLENTDGLKGASIIKREIGKYHKTIDGVEFFLKINPMNVIENSPSFRNFINLFHGVHCHYLNFLS